jgi:hypothetical protein
MPPILSATLFPVAAVAALIFPRDMAAHPALAHTDIYIDVGDTDRAETDSVSTQRDRSAKSARHRRIRRIPAALICMQNGPLGILLF